MQPDALDLPPLNCSLDPVLGDYYQDFSPAVALTESGYHGPMDDAGVPLADYGAQGKFHNAIIIAQYALGTMILAARGESEMVARSRTQLDWLVTAQHHEGPFAGCWVMEFDNKKYAWLRAPWTSALASGNAISALLRGWEMFGVERYRWAAANAYAALHDPRTDLLSLGTDQDELWYEEYPGQPPLHVLNGHIYALLGVADHARVTGDDEADARWRLAATTVGRHLADFDLGFWSAYDLRWREPVSKHYQRNIHVPQLRILAALTGEREFAVVADRWERHASSHFAQARWQVALRVHARRKQRQVAAQESAPAIALRPFPYPYHAALSICNDADLLDAASFRRLDAFLGGAEDSDWGPGLGLPVGGSFFMYRSPDSPNAFTVFDHLSNAITDDGSYILECAKRGVLDVLHTYGCFSDSSHFTRAMAEHALETLRSHGVQIETWVNHGPPSNVQGIGGRDEWQGDRVGTRGYHADLLVDYGIRWIWTGSEVVDQIALEAVRPRRRKPPGVLVEPYPLRDGQTVRRFFRYGGRGDRTPVLEDLPDQLSAANLDELVRAGGYAVVYQHLAVRRRTEGFGTGAYGPVDGAWFSADELAALRRLARRHHNGEIWVAPTTQLLRYHDTHQDLRWSVRREADRDLIMIMSPTKMHELEHLTFYCDRPATTDVYVARGDSLRQLHAITVNPADETGRGSITLGSPEETPS